MVNAIEIGTVSARGQIAIPSEIRQKMGLKEGEKLLFFLEGNDLLLRKVKNLSWDEVTRPLRAAAKKANLNQSDVLDMIQRVRKTENRP
ncbi:MAG: AbrB/MazE/SpoVT family DNA-binding domain-containing protein [Nanoarchaeota archaeon]